MSDMNITPEQIKEAIEAMAGGDFDSNPMQNPAYKAVEEATATDKVRNVTKVQGGELRCIVTDENGIKPTTIENGATYQSYDREVDAIAWLCIINNQRSILRQDKDGIVDVDVSQFRDMFGDKTGYGLSYLSSFSSNNNILLDNEKVAKYERAREYATDLIGTLNDDLKTMITTMCTNTHEFEKVCQTWDQAELFDPTAEGSTITWGCRVRTEEQYVAFESTYVILWMRPIIGNGEEDAVVPASLTQLVTRQVNPDTVPALGADSNATFLVEETLNEQVLAYAVVVDNAMTGHMQSLSLFKTKGFDDARLSF